MCKRWYPLGAPPGVFGAALGPLVAWGLLVALIGLALLWVAPRALPEAPAESRFACLSYSPWRHGSESPLRDDVISEARIENDLRRLREVTDCVRTYSSQLGMDAVPAVAARLGMHVLQGIWISRDPVANAAEIEAGLAAAGRAPAAVRALVVGNEVLLRREQPPEAMEALIRRVAERSPVPVTYADVWEFWHRNEGLADAVDFVTVHILPYWEDDPRGIEDAVTHVRDIHARMSAHFPDKTVIIGETGWPDAGRQRGPAQPGHQAQASFTRQWIAAAAESGIDYNLIEAFDQPWKRQHEGAMGGAWGVLEPDASPKFPLTGPVAEAPVLGRLMLGGAAVGLSLGLLLMQSGRRAGPGRAARRSGATAPALLGSLGALLPWQWETLVVWARTPLEWVAMGGFALLGAAFVWRVAQALCAPDPNPPGDRPDPHPWFRTLASACLLSLAYVLVLHALDDRYRGFPLSLFLAPAAALIAARLGRPGLVPLPEHARWLPIAIGVCALLMAWRGWPDNAQALGFSALALAMAVAAAGPRPRRNALRTQTPARSAAAPGSGP